MEEKQRRARAAKEKAEREKQERQQKKRRLLEVSAGKECSIYFPCHPLATIRPLQRAACQINLVANGVGDHSNTMTLIHQTNKHVSF